jgi:hypothetical protein
VQNITVQELNNWKNVTLHAGWWKEIKKLGMSAVTRDSRVSILQQVVCIPVDPTPAKISLCYTMLLNHSMM